MSKPGLTCISATPTRATPPFPADEELAIVRDVEDVGAAIPAEFEDEGDAPARDTEDKVAEAEVRQLDGVPPVAVSSAHV
jgi:hypothetical protein